MFNCPPGTHWDHVRKLCDWPEKAQCLVDSPTTTLSPTTVSTQTGYFIFPIILLNHFI